MLTAKHKAENGDEFIIECASFVRERRSDGFWQYLALPEGPNPHNEYLATWCGDEKAAQGELECQCIYLMNRDGSTVAKYVFKTPNFNVEAEAA